jgi:hypothetical protein
LADLLVGDAPVAERRQPPHNHFTNQKTIATLQKHSTTTLQTRKQQPLYTPERFRVSDFWFLVSVFGFRGPRQTSSSEMLPLRSEGCLDSGIGFRVSGLQFRFSVFDFRFPGFDFRVSGCGFLVKGLTSSSEMLPLRSADSSCGQHNHFTKAAQLTHFTKAEPQPLYKSTA